MKTAIRTSSEPSLSALRAVITILALISWNQCALAAGSCAGPAISAASVDTISGGTWTCHINDENDKVVMVASARDFDDQSNECDCGSGNNIDLSATTWVVSSGTLAVATGAANTWKAGSDAGVKTLTVTFKDIVGDGSCDDDDKEVQKSLTAFKVGVHLGTSGGSELTRWEDSTSGSTAIGNDWQLYSILTSSPNPKADGKNSVATWTLKTSPAETPIKGNIHAWASAAGYGGGENNGRIYGITTDSDWWDTGNPFADMGITFSLGYVELSPSLGFDTAKTVALLAASAAFNSELHNNYSCKVELISATTTGPSDTEGIDHSPDDAQLIGGHGFSKHAEWEIGYKHEKTVENNEWAASEVEIEMLYLWSVTDTNPWYVPPAIP